MHFELIAGKKNDAFDAALGDVTQALNLNPERFNASYIYQVRAKCHYKQAVRFRSKEQFGQATASLEDAIADLTESVHKDPENGYAYDLMALYLLEREEPEKALIAAEEAVKLDSKEGSPYKTRAECHYALGHPSLAFLDLMTAQEFGLDLAEENDESNPCHSFSLN